MFIIILAISVGLFTQANEHQLPIASLVAHQNNLTQGDSAVLSWSSQYATSCVASGGWSGTKLASGSEVVSPTLTTTYTLACSNALGSVQDSKIINVNELSLVVTKLVRNITLNQTSFTNSVDAQALDILEFRVTLRNQSNQAFTATIRDSLPHGLSYIPSTTYVNGVNITDGALSSFGVILDFKPQEEKIIKFLVVTQKEAKEQTLTSQTTASLNINPYTKQQALASVKIKNQGRVLGAGTIITGPENPLPWTLAAGFITSLFIYYFLFRYRYNGKTFLCVRADLRLNKTIRILRNKEGSADI